MFLGCLFCWWLIAWKTDEQIVLSDFGRVGAYFVLFYFDGII